MLMITIIVRMGFNDNDGGNDDDGDDDDDDG